MHSSSQQPNVLASDLEQSVLAEVHVNRRGCVFWKLSFLFHVGSSFSLTLVLVSYLSQCVY